MKMHRLFPALWALIILACLFGVQGQRNVINENQQVIGHDGRQQQVPGNLDSNVIGVAHIAQRSGVNNTVPSTPIAPEGNIARQNSMATPSMPPGEKNIVDTAIAAGNFTSLVTALQTAGLADTLKGRGPFTVFAPTDAVFAKIPKDQLTP